MRVRASHLQPLLALAAVLPLACTEETPSTTEETDGITTAGTSTGEDPTTDDTSTGGTETDTEDGTDTDADVCGDGERSATEACDDGNTLDEDGCSASCEVEPLYNCPVPGLPCVAIVCGDGKVESPETCDDGDADPEDGCDADCQVEAGYACIFPGAACQAAECGDGMLAGFEACDDGNASDGDGCSSSCVLEDGYHCPTPSAPCEPTICGDGLRQGTEHCDDGNLSPYDGCSPSCTNEPSCSGGECEAICGDGVIIPGSAEDCDDGNTVDGDGCSSSCEIEEGFECVLEDQALPDTLHLPALYRDVRGYNHTEDPRHIDFNNGSGSGITFGMVSADLAADGRPEADPAFTPNAASYHTADSFHQWYRDTPGTNVEVVGVLDLPQISPGVYEFDSAAFFPVDGLGYDDPASAAPEILYDGHNFNFTSEVRYWFEFTGTEELAFRGDDDVWVFVDGHLCLDIGGLHSAEAATMNLGDPTAEANATQRAIVQECVDRLEVGHIYEVAVFHAERHTTASNFRLTLSGFVTQTSQCDWVCGDGIVTAFEVCDDGAENNTGGFGECNEDCLGYGPYCGDGIVDPDNEACDLGPLNVGSYEGCNADCTPGPFCGDGVRDAEYEECDAGEDNGAPGSGCKADCTTPPAG